VRDSESDDDRKQNSGGSVGPRLEDRAEISIPPIELFLAQLARPLFPYMSPAQEREFHRHYNDRGATVARVGLILGEFLYLAFYFWDRVIDYAHSGLALKIRLFVMAWFFVLTVLPSQLFKRHLQTLMTPSIIAAGIGVVIIITIEHDGLNVGVSGVVLVLMFNFGFFRLLFVPSLISGILICTAYNVAAVLSSLAVERIVANNFFLLGALISGASITYLLERLFRSQFATDAELVRERAALARQLQTDSRYLDWLRRMATFLRHEVRQPIAKITSSIELIALRSDRTHSVTSYIDNALLGARDVWNLIERASRATDAEAFVRQSQPQPIDLRLFLVTLVDTYRATHSGVGFSLTAKTSVVIFADPTLLREAIGNRVYLVINSRRSGRCGRGGREAFIKRADRSRNVWVAHLWK
jgi:signal transduction histidine kinase